jgi:methylmalonyl-CoA/ethylmalonyl-CoA epimerase
VKLDHVAVAVKDADAARHVFADILGLKVVHEETVEDQGVRIVSLSMGESTLELAEPLSKDSPIAAFIMRKDEGLHHIALNVDDLEATLRDLAKKGVELVDHKPRIGAEGKKIAFLHPRSTGGVLVELSQDI